MPERVARIKSGDDLVSLLKEAQRWENAFESISEWEGFLTVKDKGTGELLLRLISESNAHEQIVESLIKMVKLQKSWSPQVDETPKITLETQSEIALLTQLQTSEMTVHDLYRDIRTALDESNLDAILDSRNVPVLLQHLDSLIVAEKKHYDLVTKCIARR